MKIITLIIFLISWYYLSYTTFIEKDHNNYNSPQLRARFGTIMHHTSGEGGEEHLYCYYPKGTTTYRSKAGEYIIKREDKIDDCNGWFGAAIFNEGYWVSEREKIWWSKKQKIGEDLVNVSTSEFNI